MITAAVEPWMERVEELKAHFPSHAEELDTYADRRPLDPNFAEYAARDAAGGVMLVIVRHDAAIIGYFVGFIGPQLHYQSTLACLGDVFYTVKTARGRVAAAGVIAMFRCVITECRRRGVKVLRAGHKLGDQDAAKLFAAFKFKPVEMIHSLWLGEEGSDA